MQGRECDAVHGSSTAAAAVDLRKWQRTRADYLGTGEVVPAGGGLLPVCLTSCLSVIVVVPPGPLTSLLSVVEDVSPQPASPNVRLKSPVHVKAVMSFFMFFL